MESGTRYVKDLRLRIEFRNGNLTFAAAKNISKVRENIYGFWHFIFILKLKWDQYQFRWLKIVLSRYKKCYVSSWNSQPSKLKHLPNHTIIPKYNQIFKININTGIEPILLECVGDELEHRSISTQTSNISLHQLFKDKMSKWCHFNFYMSRDRRYVTWVQYHGSYGHMVEPKVIKGQSSSICWLMYLLIRRRIIYSFVLNKKKYYVFQSSSGIIGLTESSSSSDGENFCKFI